ncbi:MAG: serine hydrolase domain-containing protein [Vicinamibacterales bacterium]
MLRPSRRYLPAALAVLFFSASLAAQSAPLVRRSSQSEGGPLVRATALREAVDLYRRAVEQDHIRGAVLYVAQNGSVLLHEAVGFRHHAYGVPMLTDSMFRMASNTKPVVATAVMMLAEDGKLSIDDPVAKHLPSFDNEKSRRITIAQLLSHSSGLRIEPIFYPFKAEEEVSLQAAVAKFGAEGPKEGPGTYSYNNAGYNTLGAIIEVVSGMPLEAFLKSRLYEPLGMSDTLNHEDPAKLQRMATVYRGRRSGEKVTFTQGFTPGDRPDYPVIRASGGMISTAADYAKFLEMFRQGGAYGGKRLLREETVKAMITPRARMNDAGSYGYGWMIANDGTYSHTGSDGTMAWVDPARGIIGMVLTQSPGGINPTREFRAKISAALAALSSPSRVPFSVRRP